MTVRNKLYRSFGFAPSPSVRCRNCRRTIPGSRWNGYGWVLPSHRGGKDTDKFGFCRGTGQFGEETA